MTIRAILVAASAACTPDVRRLLKSLLLVAGFLAASQAAATGVGMPPPAFSVASFESFESVDGSMIARASLRGGPALILCCATESAGGADLMLGIDPVRQPDGDVAPHLLAIDVRRYSAAQAHREAMNLPVDLSVNRSVNSSTAPAMCGQAPIEARDLGRTPPRLLADAGGVESCLRRRVDPEDPVRNRITSDLVGADDRATALC